MYKYFDNYRKSAVMLATPPSLPTFLQTLQSHYCPAVSKLLRKLLNPAHTHNKTETHLGKYLDIDNEQVSQFLSYQLQSLLNGAVLW